MQGNPREIPAHPCSLERYASFCNFCRNDVAQVHGQHTKKMNHTLAYMLHNIVYTTTVSEHSDEHGDGPRSLLLHPTVD